MTKNHKNLVVEVLEHVSNVVKKVICLGNVLKEVLVVVEAVAQEPVSNVERRAIFPEIVHKEEEVVVEEELLELASNVVKKAIFLETAHKVVEVLAVEVDHEHVLIVVKKVICLGNVRNHVIQKMQVVAEVVLESASNVERKDINHLNVRMKDKLKMIQIQLL